MDLVNVRDASGKLHKNITFARVPVVGELVKIATRFSPVTEVRHHWLTGSPVATILLGEPIKNLAALEDDGE
jgi:hypothetical protein